MGRYIIRRLLQFIPTVIGSFFLLHYIVVLGIQFRGNPARAVFGDRTPTPEMLAAQKRLFNIDDPCLERKFDPCVGLFVERTGKIARFDFGTDFNNNYVIDIMADAVPVTVRLAFIAIVVQILIGLTAGMLAGLRNGGFVDYIVKISTVLIISIPVFVLGYALQILFGVDFSVHAGEILGLGGLQGQGQAELLGALYGAERIRGGEIVIEGRSRRFRKPRHAVAAGSALIPGDRTRDGLFAVRPILENLALPSMGRRKIAGGLLSGSRERAAARDAVERLSITLGDLDDPVSTLSGGNAQKVVVGKWLLTDPHIVLMDDPTKGIDVGAKEELYGIMRSLTDEGVAILFNSSENHELLDLSDRIIVLYEGRIVDELTADQLTEARLLTASMRVDEVSDVAADEAG